MNGMLGSGDANQGDMLLGWDTDEFPFNVYDATLAMYEKHGRQEMLEQVMNEVMFGLH